MNILETTIEYKGYPVKIADNRVFLRSFGTTYDNHSMHWGWMEIKFKDLNDELRQLLLKNNLIKI